MTSIDSAIITLQHGGKLYAHSRSTDGKVVCAGCGREFKNFRGLVSHQNHRNAAAGCQPTPAVAEVEVAEPVVEPEPVAEPVVDRDELIRAAHRYAFIPERHTVLVKVIDHDKWAERWDADDAYKIARTADSSTVIKVTKHEAGGETVVTDYHWNSDGLRVRMTEKYAV